MTSINVVEERVREGLLMGGFPDKAIEKYDKNYEEEVHGLLEIQQALLDRVDRITDELEKKNLELERKIQEIENIKQYAQDIIESVTSGLIVVDSERRVTTINKRAREITGLSKKDMVGKKMPKILERIERSMIHSLTRGKSCFSEHYLTRDGREIPVSVQTSLVCDHSGKNKGAVAVINDLSQIKSLQEKLHRSKRLSALGEMAAGMAHEVRNPLGGIEGFASLLYRDLSDEPGKQKLAKNIITGAQSINRIVSDLLMFTRPISIKTSDLNLSELLDEVVMFVQTSHVDKDVTIIKEYQDTLRVEGDPHHLRQFFLNLLNNAVESTDGKVLVRLVGREMTSGTIVEIRDDGDGIEENDLEKLFDPFFTTKEKGTGLGLAIAYRIAEEHAARIEVESRKGKGTSFAVTFERAVVGENE